jgi:glutamate--cysteine ligase
MDWDFEKMIGLFSKESAAGLLAGGKFGLEREAQRVTASGDLSLSPHPLAFGSKLENPRITVDFSESQVEMITPPQDSPGNALKSLEKITSEVYDGIGDEFLWPLSMPPKLPEEDIIPIASFPDTREGREKEAYRRGLALRYGKRMQMISGIHYNFSFGRRMIEYLYENLGNGQEVQAFTNDIYLGLTRNFLRYRWLLIYLFGASPFCDETYHPVIEKELDMIRKCCPACINEIADMDRHAVSLRVSRFGYSDISSRYPVYYCCLNEYTGKLRHLMNTRSEQFGAMGTHSNAGRLQLNGNVLQKESEFYSPIRLKRTTLPGESQLDALEKRGVEYVEIRIPDIDPYECAGIGLGQMRFIHTFLLFCLFYESPPLTREELERANRNHHLAALVGRNPNLKLYKDQNRAETVKSWGGEIFPYLARIASLMDRKGTIYQDCIGAEYGKLGDISLLPSDKIHAEMERNNESFPDFGLKWARRHAINMKGRFPHNE